MTQNKFHSLYNMFTGGNMLRFIRVSILLAILTMVGYVGSMADDVYVSGRVVPGDVRIFTKENRYIIHKSYVIGGTLIIEPGTKVIFHPNGRLIDSVGGRIIADGNAEATYNANPNGVDPTSANPAISRGFSGYADLDYFTFTENVGGVEYSTVDVSTVRDITVDPSKRDIMNSVILDRDNRRIIDFNPEQGRVPVGNQELISFEEAIMFVASRLETDPANDINLNINPWQRKGGLSPNVTGSQISFEGVPVNNFSREWGHIVVLPGAREAMFRNARFENFVKDTTVDRVAYYAPGSIPGLTPAQTFALNNRFRLNTNGSGAVLTTYSSRTWLIDCEFVDNQARVRGGAVQFLEAPAGFPSNWISDEDLINGIGAYPDNKNPQVTEPDGTVSMFNYRNYNGFDVPAIPATDLLDENIVEPLTDTERQAWDDGRLALFLGRVRNLEFRDNVVQLAKVGQVMIGGVPFVQDITDTPTPYPNQYGNGAFGGAVYIAGRNDDLATRIEVGLGVNHTINIGGQVLTFPTPDSFIAEGNEVRNYQSSMSTQGARGGAVYAGAYTSLIVGGEFTSNMATTPFLEEDDRGDNSGDFSMGGAIFAENTLSRLQIRGGKTRDAAGNPTHFDGNMAGSGGAVFVDGNTSDLVSPIIGGSDNTLNTRDYGFNILFENNSAKTFGGALYSRRNPIITGDGGVQLNTLIGYGGNYPVRFWDNEAGYAGGALHVEIPNADILPNIKKRIEIVRASFKRNEVGQNVTDFDNKTEIRGGGAIYTVAGFLNVVRGTEFVENKVWNGNGGAISVIKPQFNEKRFFLTDLDVPVDIDADGIMDTYQSNNNVFVFDYDLDNDGIDDILFKADQRMLTTFKGNEVTVEDDILADQSGSGTSQVGNGVVKTNQILEGTYWLNTSEGYAVGYNGTIVKFENGGDNWSYPASGTTSRLTDVHFINSTTGFIVGADGYMLKTTDRGNTFSRVVLPADAQSNPLPTTKKINDIFFLGAVNGYAVTDDGYLLWTTDGGNNWDINQIAPSNLNGVFFFSTSLGYIAGDNGRVWKTTDGGSTWSNVSPTGVTDNLNSIYFTSNQNGTVVGNSGTIARTTDGGSTWDVILPITNYDLTAVRFDNSSTGYASGNTATILKTTDGGASWAAQATNLQNNNSLYGVYTLSATTAYAVGDEGTVIKTTDGGSTWDKVVPANQQMTDFVRINPDANLPENGVGLGGGLYILDSISVARISRTDSVNFNRVRMQDNMAYTGAAIYSDNYDLKLIFNRSLVTGNMATSEIGMEQNVVEGPVVRDGNNISLNEASSDLAGAVIYGEIQGPLPSAIYSEAANSLYDNDARFLIRLPDGPNTKGVLAGDNVGIGGTDTLRGNYWGHTEADIIVKIEDSKGTRTFETFFVAGDGNTWLPFLHTSTEPREQGPYEEIYSILTNKTYNPIPLENGTDQTIVGDLSIPENLLQSGRIYDLYDKGTDIKTADYTNRRLVPIEDFAVGIAPNLKRFTNAQAPSNGKYVKRLVRDPFAIEALDDTGNVKFETLQRFAQLEFQESQNNPGSFYHPIGYPLYLEAMVDYQGDAEVSNHDGSVVNESVFFVINETTGDYIRTTLDQVSEVAPFRETFRGRVDLVPDSTNRNPNTTIRRTLEGLFNLKSGQDLLDQLRFDPYIEDGAALSGRRYDVPYASNANDNTLGAADGLLSNRPSIPASNGDQATYWAGEKYQSLPVNVGDNVRIISRTVLWNEGITEAFNDGISFLIERSTEAPLFTGDVLSIRDTVPIEVRPSETDPAMVDTLHIEELRNTIHLREDRTYPGNYSEGRDRIFNITAEDVNQFFDIRAIANPDDHTLLAFDAQVDPSSGLARWMLIDTVNESAVNPNDPNIHLRQGYVQLIGRPVNPYVVPGGERVSLQVANFPPHFRTIDLLKEQGILSDEEIAEYVELFDHYLSNQSYDNDNARFLQQDTIFIGSSFTNDYSFRIFVIDSVPVYLDENFTEETVERVLDGQVVDIQVVYSPSEFACDKTEEGALVANLTDKLRFQIDVNTDDELEDFYAEDKWDFRYGRTAYGFVNLHDTGDGDKVVIDTTLVPNPDGTSQEIVYQARPSWLADEYWNQYDSDVDADVLGADFTTYGRLNVRIDRAEAEGLLVNTGAALEDWNVDSTFTIIVNDGHGGQSTITFPVHVNVAPVIDDVNLPDALEDTDYNKELLDLERRITVSDKNDDEYHRFYLVKDGVPLGYDGTLDVNGNVPKDPCFEEAGVWEITNDDTPDWLFINRESGLLYGTPRVKDAPTTSTVYVLVVDQYGLTDYRSFDLNVLPNNHVPDLEDAPLSVCVEQGEDYSVDLIVKDEDLLRNPDYDTETITLRVVEPNTGYEVTPSSITGDGTTDEYTITVSSTNGFDGVAVDGRVRFEIEVTDEEGETDILVYFVELSLPTNFTSELTIENSNNEQETMVWGMGPEATTGDNQDGQGFGILDFDKYCENELPPFPQQTIFDARWSIPQTEGTLKNIYPTNVNDELLVYIGRFQPGGETGNVNKYFPIRITWDANTIPDVNDADANPNGSNWYLRDGGSEGKVFSVNMKDPEGNQVLSNSADLEVGGGGIYTLVINNPAVSTFHILADINSNVETNYTAVTAINGIYPNTVETFTKVQYTLMTTSDVRFELVDMMGKVITGYDVGMMPTGTHTYDMNVVSETGAKLATGMYNVRMVVDGVQTSVDQITVAD